MLSWCVDQCSVILIEGAANLQTGIDFIDKNDKNRVNMRSTVFVMRLSNYGGLCKLGHLTKLTSLIKVNLI